MTVIQNSISLDDWPEATVQAFGFFESRLYGVCIESSNTEAALSTEFNPTDGMLMVRFQSGDQEAFRILYFRYHARLHRFVLRLVANNASAAEDIFQETWLAVIHNKHRYVKSAKFVTYLFSIAHRRVSDRWRKQYRLAALEESETDLLSSGELVDALGNQHSIDTPHERVQNEHLSHDLIAAVVALPLLQREAFLMKAEGELSLEEIAQITGVTRETVKSRLRYAISKLRLTLEQWA